MQLQAEFDREEAEERARARAGKSTKVQVVVAPGHWVAEAPRRVQGEEEWDEEEDEADERYFEEVDFIKQHLAHNSATIVTKHDTFLSGIDNAKRLDRRLAGSNLGHMSGLRVDGRSANTLARKTAKAQKSRVRKDRDNAKQTRNAVLDERTRTIIFKLVNAGHFDQLGGCISSGKEAVVFQAPLAEAYVAVKVFKTTLNEFRNRCDYMVGDHRYRQYKNLEKLQPTKLVQLWADKEFRNLCRAHKHGLPVPEPLLCKDHVLVLEFIGTAGKAALRLSDVELSSRRSRKVLATLLQFVRDLYHKCSLVHGDLSPYNVLFTEEKEVVVIDFGQAVDPKSHPRAQYYLRRDLEALHRHFSHVTEKSVDDMLEEVLGEEKKEAN
eukprot:TRINITY_DN12334_c0_g1_i1.p1 TRINITY_DN12334_c0_g1~~TRINITY_DN12334_c0_g1_i1.p1  ORF type:complete len:381 (-),score=-8.98 TRINITY_DN12334_c0_g1_i1:35-1177(-)